MSSRQLTFDLFSEPTSAYSPAIAAALAALSSHGDGEARGAVFTRVEVVEFILDLVGYTIDQPLHRQRLLEPSCGGGDFLLPAVDRLLAAWRASSGTEEASADLGNSIRAVELHHETFAATRRKLSDKLMAAGLARQSVDALVERWLVQGDFLLESITGEFDYVVGNPPYVRQELIPAPLLAAYRERYQTLYDRADLYIPFIERSLHLLAPSGSLGFICADRWMKNRYGGPLRRMVAEDFHLRVYVDMVDTDAFHHEVSAYPAITVISREAPGPTRIAHRPQLERAALAILAQQLRSGEGANREGAVREVSCIPLRDEPWLFEATGQTALLRRLEAEFPTLEAAGCKVGIGVATGADQAFIGDYDSLDVEEDRKLPLATTRDIQSGVVQWQGQGVINPFNDDGGLVDLRDYPRLSRYLEARREVIANRHCARKNPGNWYRTIDRITPSLAATPKLLIPDIKGTAHIVFEPGQLYPHHNLYHVTSAHWDLHALQAVLLSDVTRLLVAAYSTRMRGGYLRFQAQYLRRIRIPQWTDVPDHLRQELREAALGHDFLACNRAAHKLFGLSREELSLLEGMEI